MSRARASQGFTLIELMIVISIIGILAAIAIPAYQDYLRRSRMVEALVLARPAQIAVSDYYERWGRFPADNAAAGLPRPDAIRGEVVKSIAVTGGVVDVSVVQQDISGHVLLRPVVSKGHPTSPIAWACNNQKVQDDVHQAVGEVKGDLIPAKYMPVSCR